MFTAVMVQYVFGGRKTTASLHTGPASGDCTWFNGYMVDSIVDMATISVCIGCTEGSPGGQS